MSDFGYFRHEKLFVQMDKLVFVQMNKHFVIQIIENS